jgi:hypothetical protein
MNAIWVLLYIAFIVFVIASLWMVFVKAREPGWAAIIPIYNSIVVLRIVGRPIWWIILLFIPIVNIVVWIVVLVDLAHSFGMGGGFAVGLLLLPFIFFPILGFGDATYRGPAGPEGGAMGTTSSYQPVTTPPPPPPGSPPPPPPPAAPPS